MTVGSLRDVVLTFVVMSSEPTTVVDPQEVFS